MSAKHTPGPWTLETVPTQVGICHKIGPFPDTRNREPFTKPMHACIYVDGAYRAEHEPTLLANARLIAAAPELLEALKRAHACATLADDGTCLGCFVSHAIAKAEGK